MFAGKIVGCVEDDGRKGYATTTMVYDGEIGKQHGFSEILGVNFAIIQFGKWEMERRKRSARYRKTYVKEYQYLMSNV